MVSRVQTSITTYSYLPKKVSRNELPTVYVSDTFYGKYEYYVENCQITTQQCKDYQSTAALKLYKENHVLLLISFHGTMHLGTPPIYSACDKRLFGIVANKCCEDVMTAIPNPIITGGHHNTSLSIKDSMGGRTLC